MDITWRMRLGTMNPRKSANANWGPLSDTTVSGRPSVASNFCKALIAAGDVTVGTGMTSIYLE